MSRDYPSQKINEDVVIQQEGFVYIGHRSVADKLEKLDESSRADIFKRIIGKGEHLNYFEIDGNKVILWELEKGEDPQQSMVETEIALRASQPFLISKKKNNTGLDYMLDALGKRLSDIAVIMMFTAPSKEDNELLHDTVYEVLMDLKDYNIKALNSNKLDLRSDSLCRYRFLGNGVMAYFI